MERVSGWAGGRAGCPGEESSGESREEPSSPRAAQNGQPHRSLEHHFGRVPIQQSPSYRCGEQPSAGSGERCRKGSAKNQMDASFPNTKRATFHDMPYWRDRSRDAPVLPWYRISRSRGNLRPVWLRIYKQNPETVTFLPQTAHLTWLSLSQN